MTTFVDPDTAPEERASERLPDPLSEFVGKPTYVRRHRLDCHINTPMGQTPRFAVSRFYWEPEPPVAIDFLGEIRFGDAEIKAKREYCEARKIRYLICQNEWDTESLLEQIPRQAPTRTKDAAPPGSKPVTGPRRRQSERDNRP